MIDARLFGELFRVFPDSFSCTRTYEPTERIAGAFWIEERKTGEVQTVILAECILNTAQGIAIKYGMDRAIAYIGTFGRKSVQKSELAKFQKED